MPRAETSGLSTRRPSIPSKAKVRSALLAALVGVLLPGLQGCDAPYEKKNGMWQYDGQPITVNQPNAFKPLKGPFARSLEGGYYRGHLIDGSDSPSFEALDDHYARDKARVYFCDTYRKGQDYYTVKYNRIDVLGGADAASFRVIKSGYARDAKNLFYDGRRVSVKDLESFVPLEYPYAKDKLVGYYEHTPVAGSDGASFAVLSLQYAKDKAHVYYSFVERDEPHAPGLPRSVRMSGADPATFEVLPGGDGDADAKDAHGRFKQGKRLVP